MVFHAGPWDSSVPKSFSFYEISRNPPVQVLPDRIAAESALSTDILRDFPETEPSRHVRPFLSRTGNTLLIEETLPITTWPCSNWILVRYEQGALGYDYLVPPERQVRPTADTSEIPKVTSISDSEITYRYSDGKEGTVSSKNLVKKEKRPIFPG